MCFYSNEKTRTNLNMKKQLIILTGVIVLFLISCGPKISFEDQIKDDLSTKLPTGICDSIPLGATISNIVVGEIVDIGLQGMTDVSYELDYESNGSKKHHTSALLYIRSGSTYKLASMGGCEYEMK